ncbi:hypothetical protein Q3G72_002405 [Acer saccharum]|nr:hypothetical protein Q3G72_002405 [Acer saccharum]
MCNARALGGVVLLLLVVVVLHCNVVTLVSAQGSNTGPRWQTLSLVFDELMVIGKATSFVMLAGDPPLVVARGGFSGLLQDSSLEAYTLAVMLSVPDVMVWCDVQLTKDAIGICFPDVKLQNASNIAEVYKGKDNAYLVNEVPTEGRFPIDYTIKDLANVSSIDCFSHLGRNASNQVDLKSLDGLSIKFMPRGSNSLVDGLAKDGSGRKGDRLVWEAF